MTAALPLPDDGFLLRELALPPGSPADLWAFFAPAIAGTPRVRTANTAGQYPKATERALTAELPAVPAAVRVYADDGTARSLVLDLDVSAAGGRHAVLADTRAALSLLEQAGMRSYVDESPGGGRHVYAPLARPARIDDLRTLYAGFAALLPTLDRSPVNNPKASLIRPPGAAYKTGGHQRLVTDLAAAKQAVLRPNGEQVLAALRALVEPAAGTAPTDPDRRRDAVNDPGLGRVVAWPGTPRPLDAPLDRIASTGTFPRTPGPGGEKGYATRSEARWAVLVSAARRCWSLDELEDRIRDGAWKPLLGLFAKDGSCRREQDARRRLRADWARALDEARKPAIKPVRNSDTRQPKATTRARGLPDVTERERPLPGDLWRVRWWLAVELAGQRGYWKGKSGLRSRAVLHAVGAHAQMSRKQVLDIGVRHLSLAAGMSPDSVAEALRVLRSDSDGFLTLLEGGRGDAADLYELRIPAWLDPDVPARPRWQRIDRVPPVFKLLGLPAFFVWAALDGTPASPEQVAVRAGVSRTAAYEALARLADVRLAARRKDGRVRRGPRTVTAVGKALGVPELVLDLLARFRREREAWRTFLMLVRPHALRSRPASAPSGPHEPARVPPLLIPPDGPEPAETALELVWRVLGGVPIDPARGTVQRSAVS